jgi:hypothetical protein
VGIVSRFPCGKGGAFVANEQKWHDLVSSFLGWELSTMSAAPFLKFATVAFIGAPMQPLRIIAVIAARWLAIMRTSLFSQRLWLPIWVQLYPFPRTKRRLGR